MAITADLLSARFLWQVNVIIRRETNDAVRKTFKESKSKSGTTAVKPGVILLNMYGRKLLSSET